MLPKCVARCAGLFALMCVLAAAAAAQPSLAGLGRASVPLDGPWRFHTGDDPAWASPAFDDSGWEQMQAGRDWEHQGHPDLTGYGWYRMRIDLPATTPRFEMALYLPNVEDAAEVYFNGRLAGRYGKLPPQAEWYLFPNPSLGVIPLGQVQSGVLAIRVWKAPHAYQSSFGEGGLTGVPLLGSAEAVRLLRTQGEHNLLRAILALVFVALVAALISLGAWIFWLRDRSNWMVFWLALYMLRPLAILLIAASPWRVGYGLDGMVYSGADAALWFLLLYLLNLRSNPLLLRWTKIFAIISIGSEALEGSLQLFDWQHAAHAYLLADVCLTIPGLLTQVWGVILVLFAFRQRLDWPRWFLVISALLMDVFADAGAWVGLGMRWTHWTAALYMNQPLFHVFGGSVDIVTFCATLTLIAVPLAAWRSAAEQRRRATELEQEYRSAQQVQQVLIPEELPTVVGFSISSAYRPAREVGGDFFQILPLPAGESLVVIGDVSGKGLGAAMAVALIVGSLRATAETTSQPAKILAALNRRLHGRLHRGFATCLVLHFAEDGTCVAANAGHLSPYLNGREIPTPPALPLGLIADAEYEEVALRLAPGDRLTCFTDGVLEARNSEGELLGFTRAAALAVRDAVEMADAAQQFGQDDDITVLSVCRAAQVAETVDAAELRVPLD